MTELHQREGNNMDQYCSLYKKLGLLAADNHELPMHRVCAKREACWAEAQSRLPPDNGEMSWISRPWVGPRYQDLHLVAVGVNLNEYGGLDTLAELAEEAKVLISGGHRRVRFHCAYVEYAGSFLWHRLGCYSAVIAEASDAMVVTWGEDGYPSPQSASQAFDRISLVEHVKCAPMGEKSKPTSAMWDNCGSHILKEELAILKPFQLLVLGTSDNAWCLSEHVLDSRMVDARKQGSVTIAAGSIAEKPVRIIVVPHPTSYGGASKSVLEDLKNALRTTTHGEGE